MKKIIFAIIALCAVVSCTQTPSFTIEGDVAGVAGKAVLSYENPVSKVQVNDTVAIENGKFIFEGAVEDVVPARITIIPNNEKAASTRICLENDALSININWSSVVEGRRNGRIITVTEVLGGANNTFKRAYDAIPDSIISQEKYKDLKAATKELDKYDMRADFEGYMKAYGEFMKNYKAQQDSAQIETVEAQMAFIKANPAVESAAESFSKFITTLTLEQMEEVFYTFTPKVQNSFLAKKVKDEIVALNAVKPGNVAPDFTLKTLAGDDFTLSSLKGKYVVLDFWASWCGPCRASIPGIKELYAQYKEKGLEIVGVSCDKDAAAWKKAIEDDQIPWIHVIDTQDASRAAGKYAVHYIPSLFLIDQEGKMIGKIDHHDLAAKMKELLGE